MTNEQLLNMLSEFEPSIESVNIAKEYALDNLGVLIIADIHYKDNSSLHIPLVHYTGCDWLMTPKDWQDESASDITPSDIDRVQWRVDASDTEAIMLDGLPRLAPWCEDPDEIKQRARKTLGEALRQARIGQNLTTRQLAERCGLSNSHITRIESGRYAVTIDSIGLVANALGLRFQLM